MAIKTAIPVGPLSATIGYIQTILLLQQHTVGVSTSMSAGNGTVSVAYVSTDNQSADATLAISNELLMYYNSQSVGTGASVFAEFVSRSGAAASSDTSAVLLGSSFAF